LLTTRSIFAGFPHDPEGKHPSERAYTIRRREIGEEEMNYVHEAIFCMRPKTALLTNELCVNYGTGGSQIIS
jgi:hypothetical protein